MIVYLHRSIREEEGLVRWVSGWNHQFAKLTYGQPYRGFESPSHRKIDRRLMRISRLFLFAWVSVQAHTLANKKYEPVALCRFFDDRGDSHLNKGVARIELCLLLGLKTCAIRYPRELELALDLRIPLSPQRQTKQKGVEFSTPFCVLYHSVTNLFGKGVVWNAKVVDLSTFCWVQVFARAPAASGWDGRP